MFLTRRLLAPLAAIGLSAGLLVVAQSPADAASPAVAPTRVVLKPLQKKVQRYNSTFRISGQTEGENAGTWGYLPSGDAVGTAQLQRKYAGTSTWRTVQTDSSPGQFSFSVKAIKNSSYRVVYSGGSYGTYVFPAATSANRWQLVRRNLNDYLSRAGGFFIKGKLRPAGKRYVFVERKTCSTCKYRPYRKVLSNRYGAFKARIGVPKRGTHYYRAYVKANTYFTKSLGNKYYRTYRY